MYQAFRGENVFLSPLRVPGWAWRLDPQRQMNRRNAHTFVYVLQGVELPKGGRLEHRAKA